MIFVAFVVVVVNVVAFVAFAVVVVVVVNIVAFVALLVVVLFVWWICLLFTANKTLLVGWSSSKRLAAWTLWWWL